jgi:hypothetical protein
MGALHTSLLIGAPLVESIKNRSLGSSIDDLLFPLLLVADAHALIREP